jgi:starch-binding outer membrane protein, SusD/RagB family
MKKKMRTTLKYILTIVAVLITSSCSKDFLELSPEDSLSFDNYFNDVDEVRSATASLYGYPWFEFNDKFFWLAGDCMSGNILYTYDQEGQYYYFSFTAGNSYLNSGWRGLYRVLSYANSIINDMPDKAASNGVAEADINAALGEARFVRGMVYYILAEFWGEVPIVENNTQLVSDNNLRLPKNTRASIYELIRRDMEYAFANLPSVDAQAGRVTRWAAEGMLAKVHLTMAQSGIDAANNFTLAKEFAEDVITNSGLSLLENYRDLFLMDNNNNEESLFAMQWMKGGYSLGNSRNANWARSSLIADQQWGGGKGCTYDFQQIVEAGDLRRKEIYMTLGDYYPELSTATGGYTYNFETANPANESSPLESPNEVLNHLKKYVVGRAEDNNGNVGIDQDAGNNVYLLRLADVYLLYSEAVLGSASSTADAAALEYFNAIRERAGLEPKTEISFMDILNERRVEFCLESMFWFDVKRYYYRDPEGALNYLNSQKRHWVYTTISGSEDPNLRASYELQEDRNDPVVVTENDFFLPIPEQEVTLNPLLATDAAAEDYDFTE